METLISDSDLTVQKLEAVFKAAFMSCSIDSDGDLRIEDRGIKVFLRVNTEKKRLIYTSLWGLKTGAFTESKKLSFLNKLNNEYVLVRFSMPRPDTLLCDYLMLYEGGVSPFQLVNTYRLFAGVCKAIPSDDADNLLG